MSEEAGAGALAGLLGPGGRRGAVGGHPGARAHDGRGLRVAARRRLDRRRLGLPLRAARARRATWWCTCRTTAAPRRPRRRRRPGPAHPGRSRGDLSPAPGGPQRRPRAPGRAEDAVEGRLEQGSGRPATARGQRVGAGAGLDPLTPGSSGATSSPAPGGPQRRPRRGRVRAVAVPSRLEQAPGRPATARRGLDPADPGRSRGDLSPAPARRPRAPGRAEDAVEGRLEQGSGRPATARGQRVEAAAA